LKVEKNWRSFPEGGSKFFRFATGTYPLPDIGSRINGDNRFDLFKIIQPSGWCVSPTNDCKRYRISW